MTAPLYNPVATVGLKEPSFFTEAHLTVTLDRDVAPLIEGTHHSFAPVIKFEFVGSDSKPVSLRGHTPEPASFVIWGGGLLAAAGICRWRHRRRRKA